MGFHRTESIMHPYKEFNFTLIVDLDMTLMSSILFCSDNPLNCDMTLTFLYMFVLLMFLIAITIKTTLINVFLLLHSQHLVMEIYLEKPT